MAHLYVLDLHYVADLAEIERHLPAHREFLARGYADGLLLASGRKEPRTGGVIIAAGERAAVEKLVATDPFRVHGVAEYSITEFLPTMTAPLLESVQER